MPSGPPFHVLLIPRDASALTVSFESAIETLQAMPNVHAEWDGSFVWRTSFSTSSSSSSLSSPPSSPPPGGQIDGMIYDAAGQIRHVDLKGRCGIEEWRFLCELFAGRTDSALPSGNSIPPAPDSSAPSDASARLAGLAVQVLSSPDRPVLSLPDFQAAFLTEDRN